MKEPYEEETTESKERECVEGNEIIYTSVGYLQQ